MQDQAGAAVGNSQGCGKQTLVLRGWGMSWFLWENMIGLFKQLHAGRELNPATQGEQELGLVTLVRRVVC